MLDVSRTLLMCPSITCDLLVFLTAIRILFQVRSVGFHWSFDDAHIELATWFHCPRRIHTQDDGALKAHKIVVRSSLGPIEHVRFEEKIHIYQN
jgi:hypothetical protein